MKWVKSENNKFEANIKYENKKPELILKGKLNWDTFLWYVINSSNIPKLEEIKNDEYVLGENDILKIGTYKYIVSKIHIKGKEINKKEKFFDFSPPLKKVKKCEFCGEIMVRLCDCEEYFHVEEIKAWIKKIFTKNIKNKTFNYYFEIRQCEGESIKDNDKIIKIKDCDAYYPLNFKYDPKDLDDKTNEDSEGEEAENIEDGNYDENNYKEISFFDFEIPKDKDYMILESFPEKEANQNSNKNVKSVHIVELTGGPIKIGRSKKNDIILQDKKVSSEHAIIEYRRDSGKLTIKNLSEHFGTLALIYSPSNKFNLEEKPIFFQANKSLIEASVMNLSDYMRYKKNTSSEYPLVFEDKKKDKDKDKNKDKDK